MNEIKEVYYKDYCKKCKYVKLKEHEDPCNDCLGQPYNYNSHKPIHFKEGSMDESKQSKKIKN